MNASLDGELKRGPLVSAGVLMGAGLGGFVDGIVLHQMLQWHNMLSARVSASTLVGAKINMFWDGVFHAGVWMLTVIGLAMLFHAGTRRDVVWSPRVFVGSLLCGYGLFNLVEGLIDHEILGLHHVYEYTSNHLPWDLAFLFLGALLVLVGGALIRAGGSDQGARGDSYGEHRGT